MSNENAELKQSASGEDTPLPELSLREALEGKLGTVSQQAIFAELRRSVETLKDLRTVISVAHAVSVSSLNAEFPRISAKYFDKFAKDLELAAEYILFVKSKIEGALKLVEGQIAIDRALQEQTEE
jgi:hypothetical protein